MESVPGMNMSMLTSAAMGGGGGNGGMGMGMGMNMFPSGSAGRGHVRTHSQGNEFDLRSLSGLSPGSSPPSPPSGYGMQ